MEHHNETRRYTNFVTDNPNTAPLVTGGRWRGVLPARDWGWHRYQAILVHTYGNENKYGDSLHISWHINKWSSQISQNQVDKLIEN